MYTRFTGLCFFLFLFISFPDLPAQNNPAWSHLSYSQVGYDTGLPKYAMIRDSAAGYLSKDATFVLKKICDGKKVAAGKPEFLGQKWKQYWWKADFSGLDKPGGYFLEIRDGKNNVLTSDLRLPIKIGEGLLWNETWYATALEHLLVRDSLSYQPEGGWKDCGSTLQEVSSHAIMLNGLCDLLEQVPLSRIEAHRDLIREQLVVGADYIAHCQDRAFQLGYQEGAVVHETRENLKVVTGNVAKTAMILARISRLLEESNGTKSREYKKRALKSYSWIDRYGPQLHWENSDNFAITHGAPYGMKRPPEEWMTRDMVMMMWAALELWKCGETEYKQKAVGWARKIMARQVPREKNEEGLYGHFYTYDSFDFTEKANIHCGAWNANYKAYNQGGHFPHYLVPMVEMVRIWGEHPDAPKWERTVRDFAYGYFIPATSRNPFKILPAGYYKGEGLLNFSGWYHGHNKIFGYAAALALEFHSMFSDPAFVEIATANLQWIAGLHCGFPEEDEFSSASMIVGVGNCWMADWDAMKGTITNGFEADGQFRLTRPSIETDLPVVFGDEGGIHHPAGWISGLSRLIRYQDTLTKP